MVLSGGIGNFGTLTATDVTLDSNQAYGYGGGIVNDGTATLSHVTLAGNYAGFDGGGIYNTGSLTITDATLAGNTANDNTIDKGGGGIWNGGTATLSHVTLDSNQAVYGGGIENFESASLTLSNVTLSGNTANNSGGGIYNYFFGSATIYSSTVSGNSASIGYGGGIKNDYGILTLTNSTVSGNTAGYGGGIYNSGTGRLTNVTLGGNARVAGGGLYQDGVTTTNRITLENTLIASALGANCYVDPGSATPIASNGYNLSSDGSCTAYLTQSGDLNNTNPQLGPLQNNGGATQTHALLPGSPAIDAIPFGVNGCGTTLTTDQRGVTRPMHDKCDIGAYETDYFDVFLPLTEK